MSGEEPLEEQDFKLALANDVRYPSRIALLDQDLNLPEKVSLACSAHLSQSTCSVALTACACSASHTSRHSCLPRKKASCSRASWTHSSRMVRPTLAEYATHCRFQVAACCHCIKLGNPPRNDGQNSRSAVWSSFLWQGHV